MSLIQPPPSELLLAGIIDSSEDAIISKDLHSTVTSWNKSAERIFGYTAEDMIGQSISILFPEDRLNEEPQILQRLQRGERVEHFESIRRRKNGTLLHVSLTISPIRDASGVIIGASKIARDITEQKVALQKLAEAHEELKRADQMKAEFLATLSHELRTPLTAILGWIQILKDDASPVDLEQGLAIIERNVRTQAQLIDDLLDMSRIEAGKVSLDVQRVDLPAVVGTAIETVRPAAEAKMIRLTSAFSSIDSAVMADRNRLQQIVWNLLSNAIKFTPKHGRVHVVIERINSHVEICVTDSGQGIPPEFLAHVFDRFRQADASITRRHGGLGLGLSIAKHLTELHGGSLRAASPGVDRGASFTIHLPLLPIQQDDKHASVSKRNADVDGALGKNNLKGVRVLAVDDEPDSLGIVKLILERSGATVSAAGSMEEALAEFDRCAPHVIVSDIGMPGHDGYELITRIRKLPGGRAIPAIALTALARTEDRTRALRAGFQVHMAKPVEAAELLAVVENLASLRSDP